MAAEAARAAGAEWKALSWTGPKPAAGLPAAARSARHRLLAEAARDAGASVLLLGHTLDDQRESALMRRTDTPGLGQLREWSPSPVWPEGRGVFLLRPLLNARRADLRALLRQLGAEWIEDPANDDPRYARARARQALGAPSVGSPARGGAAALSSTVEPGRGIGEAGTEGAHGWLVTPDGRIAASRPSLDAAFCAAALLCASGTQTPPRGDKLAQLMGRLSSGADFTATLAGARVTASGAAAWFGREAGERARGGLEPLALFPGRPLVWDGRFEIAADRPGLTVHPAAGRLSTLDLDDRRRLKTLPPQARGAVPVLIGEGAIPLLPRPFGEGPAIARCLVEARLKAALGLVKREPARLG